MYYKHITAWDLYIKGEAAKTSLATFCFPYISALGARIFKMLVSTPHNIAIIMGDRQKNCEDPSTCGWDVRKTKSCERRFCCLTLYIGSVLDKVSGNHYTGIQKTLDHFVLYNSYLEPNKTRKQWVKSEKHKGGYGKIRVSDFFKSIKTSWLKRYATSKINDHWCDILDQKFELTPQTRETIYKWGAAKFDHIINLKLPCISEFVEWYQQFLISFPTEPNTKENRWLEMPFFHNPKIQHGSGRNKKTYTPRQFGLTEKASILSLGQLFVNLKPIGREDLKNLGFEIPILEHNRLQMNLKSLIGVGKTFNGFPKKVPITQCSQCSNVLKFNIYYSRLKTALS